MQFVRLVRNQSSRNGAKIVRLVAHTTEGNNYPGLQDLRSLGNWFDNPAAQASSHKGYDKEGNAARFVPDSRKAWTQAAYNPTSLSAEFIGFAAWGPKQWREAEAGLNMMAKDFAIWAHRYNIPLRWDIDHGICEHRELGVAGGGHHDCGSDFPREHFLDLIKAHYADPEVEAEAKKKERWKDSLANERARLKSILVTRKKLRQKKLENSVKYSLSTKQLKASRTRIEKLLKLIARKP